MNFSVISEEDAKAKFRKSNNKIVTLQIIADLTASTKEEVADFLGIELIKKHPWIKCE